MKFRLAAFAMVFPTMLGGCGYGNPAQLADENFGLCLALPDNARYETTGRGIDFDTGRLIVDNKTVDVYIGFAPNFPRRALATEQGPSDGFGLMGRDVTPDADRVLLGYKRPNEPGKLMVMFSARSLSGIDQFLLARNFVTSCQPANG